MFKNGNKKHNEAVGQHVSGTIKPEINLDMILKIHPQNDAYVAFTRKVNRETFDKKGHKKNFETLFSIKVGELKNMFHKMRLFLLYDSFFSVNGFWRPAPYQNKTTQLPGVCRKEKDLRYLCACYADLDFYKDGGKDFDFIYKKAFAQIQCEVLKKEILPPSIICRSGRGAYLLWLLRDEKKKDLPPRAWPETIRLYKKINKALGSRLTHLKWDPVAHDAARVLRVPGSCNTKGNRIVNYQMQSDQSGQPFTYTLEEMADFFGVPVIKNSDAVRDIRPADMPEYRVTKQKGSVPKRRNGQMVLNAHRAGDFVTIMQHRGGIKKGNRYMLLCLYAGFLRRFMGKKEARRELNKMASSCVPPYPSDHSDTPVTEIVDQVFNGEPVKKFSNKTLCKWLGVTPELAREIHLKTIVPDEVARERKEQPGTREREKQRRRVGIREILERCFDASIREVKGALENEGIGASLGTLQKEIPQVRSEISAGRLNECEK